MSLQDLERSVRESSAEQLIPVRVKGNIPNVTVVCDPNYMHELLAYYHWGERNASNYLEDVSRISGQVFITDDELVIVPRFHLRIASEQRSKTGVTASIANKQAAEYQNNVCEESLSHTDYGWLTDFGPLRVIGHCHSHPDLGAIGVNPSAIDVADHTSSISDGRFVWLSQIVDPIRKMTAFYYGKDLKTPNVVYYLYPADVNVFRYGYLFRRQKPKALPKHVHEVRKYELPPQLQDDSKSENSNELIPEPEHLDEPSGKETAHPTEKTVSRHSKKDRQRKKTAKMKIKKILKTCIYSDAYLEQLAQIVLERFEE